MSLYEIDPAATRARLDAIAANGLRALSECARRSEEIDKQVRDMLARQERAKRAMEKLVKQATEDTPPPRPAARPATLRLGADEFREARQVPLLPMSGSPGAGPIAQADPGGPARTGGQAAAGGRAGSGTETGSGPETAAGRGGATESDEEHTPPPAHRTLMLGAPEDRAEPAEDRAPARPQPRRAPVEQDDDLSGRTWLR